VVETGGDVDDATDETAVTVVVPAAALVVGGGSSSKAPRASNAETGRGQHDRDPEDPADAHLLGRRWLGAAQVLGDLEELLTGHLTTGVSKTNRVERLVAGARLDVGITRPTSPKQGHSQGQQGKKSHEQKPGDPANGEPSSPRPRIVHQLEYQVGSHAPRIRLI
jgi:hypothetical protein